MGRVPPDEQQLRLIERIRTALDDEPGITVQEKRMFGVLAFMVDDALLVAAEKGGGLLARVDPDRSAELLARPGAQQAVMGDRSMGPSWLRVDAHGIADDPDLAFWIATTLQFNRANHD